MATSASAVSKRIVVGLNQVDLVYPSDWLEAPNIPSVEQDKNIKKIINERIKSIKKVCTIKPSNVVAYSASKRYHLAHLFAPMVTSTAGPAWVLDAKKNIADYLEIVDPKYLPEHLRSS